MGLWYEHEPKYHYLLFLHPLPVPISQNKMFLSPVFNPVWGRSVDAYMHIESHVHSKFWGGEGEAPPLPRIILFLQPRGPF